MAGTDIGIPLPDARTDAEGLNWQARRGGCSLCPDRYSAEHLRWWSLACVEMGMATLSP